MPANRLESVSNLLPETTPKVPVRVLDSNMPEPQSNGWCPGAFSVARRLECDPDLSPAG